MRKATVLAAALLAAAPAGARAADSWFTVPLSSPAPAGSPNPDVQYGGASHDGRIVAFNTSERLLPEDTDDAQDVYVREGAQLRLASTPEGDAAGGAAGFEAISDDGSTILFRSNEDFTPEGSEDGEDLFMRRDGHTVLVTPAAQPLIQHFGPNRVFLSADGSHVVFNTDDALLPADKQTFPTARTDAYDFSGGELHLLTRGARSDDDAGAVAMSSDGTRVFVETGNAYDAVDNDAENDVYLREGATTTLLTPDTPDTIGVAGISRDGSHAYFDTPQALLPADTDAVDDVYSRTSTGPYVLISTGPLNPNTDDAVDFQTADTTGAHVVFTTRARLTADDIDNGTAATGAEDIYMRRDEATTTLESTADVERPQGYNGLYTFAFLTPAGTHLYWYTRQQLVDDQEGFFDTYDRHDGTTDRISVGDQNDQGFFDAPFGGAADDGSRGFFITDGRFTAADVDDRDDIYARAAGATTLVTPAPATACDLDSFCNPVIKGNAADGTRMRFTTGERLATTDTDDSADLYESRLVATPVLSSALGTLTVPEQAAGVAVLTDVTVAEPYDDVFGATVAITGGSSGDTLGFTDTAAINGTLSADGRTLTLSGRATDAAYQEALRAVTFTNTSDDPATGNRTVSATLSNGGATSAAASRTVTVTPVDDAPAVAGGGNVAYAENAKPRVVTPGLTVADPDDIALAGATVAITGGYAAGEDVLDLPSTPGISAAYANGTLTLTGAASLADYQAALRTVRYRNTSDAPSDATRTVTVTADDGELSSTAATASIEVIPVDDAPSIDLNATPATATAGGAPVALDDAATVGDPDSATLARITVTFASGRAAGDALAGGGAGPVSAAPGPDGSLVLTGAGSPAQYQAALRTVTLVPASIGDRVLEVTADDGERSGAPRRRAFVAPTAASAPTQTATPGPTQTAVPTGTPSPTPSASPPPAFAVAQTKLTKPKRVRRGVFRVICTAEGHPLSRCNVIVRGAGKRLGGGIGQARKGKPGSLRVTVRLNAAGRRLLRRRGRLTVRLLAAAGTTDGVLALEGTRRTRVR